MIKRIEYIKDVVGNNFLGVKYSQDELKPFLADLREELESDEEYNHYTGNTLKTNGYFHIEVVNTMALKIHK